MSGRADDTSERTPGDAGRGAPAPVFAKGVTVPGLNSWLLDRKLGGGGFGEVWLARHAWNAKEKPRAVKFCTDRAARHRLVTHERNVVLRVMKYAADHPHVVPLLECNLDGEVPWLMYEFVEGGTLAGVVAQWRTLDLSDRLGRAVRVLSAVAGALARFHRFDPPLVHRDMKPQNVLMAGAVPRITDFGIGSVVVPDGDSSTVAQTANAARLPSSLHAAGTRIYASPERLRGSPPSPRDDVFALGVIAYQMVTADLTATPGADAALELRDLGVPEELASLIVRSVSTNADRRPPDAGEWEAVLAGLLHNGLPQADAGAPEPGSEAVLLPDPLPKTELLPTEPMTLAAPAAKPARNRWLWALAATLVLAAGAVGGYYALRDPRSDSTTTDGGVANGDPSVPPGDPPKAAPVPPKPGETRDFAVSDGLTMRFCWVPAGEAQLGSPKAERDAMAKAYKMTTETSWLQAEAEEKRGTFTTPGFWMGKYEVVQAEWAALIRATPSHFRVGGPKAGNLKGITDTSRFPVESVSWDDCQKFLKELNARPGREAAFGKAGAFALPHENEWEYACRGGLGNKPVFGFGPTIDGGRANFDGRHPFGPAPKGAYLERPAVVGSYADKWAHPWGLCDMHGNVSEWCDSVFEGTKTRVFRGGSWYDDGASCRSAGRRFNAPANVTNNQIGFRIIYRPE